MSDTAIPNETTTETTAPATAADEAADETNHEDADAGREAAKYRRRLRDTEAERDRLGVRAETAQRQLVDFLADVNRVKPAALWASGVQLGDLLDDDGKVDPVKVKDACTGAIDALGLAGNRASELDRQRRGVPAPDKSAGRGNTSVPDFAHAFRPR